jgi:hypothetical protein
MLIVELVEHCKHRGHMPLPEPLRKAILKAYVAERRELDRKAARDADRQRRDQLLCQCADKVDLMGSVRRKARALQALHQRALQPGFKPVTEAERLFKQAMQAYHCPSNWRQYHRVISDPDDGDVA